MNNIVKYSQFKRVPTFKNYFKQLKQATLEKPLYKYCTTFQMPLVIFFIKGVKKTQKVTKENLRSEIKRN